MSKEREIQDKLLAIGKGTEKTFIAVVIKNYPDKDYIDAEDLSGTKYTEVRKRASIGEPKKGILITPANGSTVIVGRIGDSDELFVEMFSSVDSIQFDGGENGGLVKVADVTAKLNSLEKDLNDLKQAISTWIPTPNDGGSALKAKVSSWAGSRLTETKKEDLQNDKVKH